jgi:hypothetical protein
MRLRARTVTLFLVLVVLGIVSIFMGSRFVAGSTPTASIRLEPVITGGSLHVRGITDLPDGAHIVYSIGAGSSPEEGFGGPYVDDSVAVAAGRFNEAVDIARFPSGPITVWAAFDPTDDQPPAVVERFGTDGSRLRGPDVVDDFGRRLIAIAVIEKP